jgi:hypothetical protein
LKVGTIKKDKKGKKEIMKKLVIMIPLFMMFVGCSRLTSDQKSMLRAMADDERDRRKLINLETEKLIDMIGDKHSS